METVSHHLDLPTISNCRDLGGIPTTTGKKVKPHLLIRSANLHHADSKDLHVLDAMGVKNIVDLRTQQEEHAEPDHLLHDWNYELLATFTESAAWKNQLKDLLARPGTFIEDLYPMFIDTDTAKHCWTVFFQGLLEHDGGTLFHCTQGKDRTGVAAALVLASLDVDLETIRNDYLQTNIYMTEETPKFVGMLEKILGQKLDAEIDEFLLATPLYFDTFVAATEPYGGLKGYVKECAGVSDADFATLQEKYLEPIK